jgi:hypothetical protein
MQVEPGSIESPVMDLLAVDLGDLAARDDDALGRSLRHVLRDVWGGEREIASQSAYPTSGDRIEWLPGGSPDSLPAFDRAMTDLLDP